MRWVSAKCVDATTTRKKENKRGGSSFDQEKYFLHDFAELHYELLNMKNYIPENWEELVIYTRRDFLSGQLGVHMDNFQFIDRFALIV